MSFADEYYDIKTCLDITHALERDGKLLSEMKTIVHLLNILAVKELNKLEELMDE